MRNMKYRLDNETQGRMAAEGLISQLRDQLKRGDEKYASYDLFLFPFVLLTHLFFRVLNLNSVT